MKETIRRLWRPFIFILVIALLGFNWQRIIVFSNYQVFYGKLRLFLEAPEKVKPPAPAASRTPVVSQASIVIPKIGVDVPLVFTAASNPDFKASLEKGAVHFPTSALPGEAGAVIILGHSAPDGWPRAGYQWIFSDLDDLSAGDPIYINFNNRQYIYRVQQSRVVGKGQEIPFPLTNEKPVLILLSCWPPGKDLYRIALEAALQ